MRPFILRMEANVKTEISHIIMTFFKYSCQPTGSISEGERQQIINQSKLPHSAPLGERLFWLSRRMYAQVPSGRFSSAWISPDHTLCSISILTAASHGLDYSTALPVPASAHHNDLVTDTTGFCKQVYNYNFKITEPSFFIALPNV